MTYIPTIIGALGVACLVFPAFSRRECSGFQWIVVGQLYLVIALLMLLASPARAEGAPAGLRMCYQHHIDDGTEFGKWNNHCYSKAEGVPKELRDVPLDCRVTIRDPGTVWCRLLPEASKTRDQLLTVIYDKKETDRQFGKCREELAFMHNLMQDLMVKGAQQ